MSRDLHCQRVGDSSAGAPAVLHPARQRQRNPHRMPVGQELDVHGIRVARGDGQHQRLIQAVHLFSRPAFGDAEILVHGDLSIYTKSAASINEVVLSVLRSWLLASVDRLSSWLQATMNAWG